MGKVINKISIAIIFLLILSSCTSLTRHRFPDYGEEVKNHSSVSVVVDLFVYRDIAGTKRGVNREVLGESLESAVLKINELLTERGFSNQIIKTLNGLTYKIAEDKEYVVSENWKSTEQPYRPLFLEQSDDPWLTAKSRMFFTDLVLVAQEIDAKKNEGQSFAETKVVNDQVEIDGKDRILFSQQELDLTIFDDLNSDVVLFVQVEGRFQKLSKYLANGLLVGGVSSVLTGGFWLVPPGSYFKVHLVAFDADTRNVLWHIAAMAEGSDSVQKAIERAFEEYPYNDGETAREKKLKRVRESQ